MNNPFEALAYISILIESEPSRARECLIRLLEYRNLISKYDCIIDSLIQKVGLFPYLEHDFSHFSTSDLLNLEFHSPDGMKDVYLHSLQAKIYFELMDGKNVILSAPTSFGKSLLIDAAIASLHYTNIIVIVPTIALIDETRRRLTNRFKDEFKIITHPTQNLGKKNIFIYTQERYLEDDYNIVPGLFIIDEFYKLNPIGSDERSYMLNQAFYKLFKTKAQFFLIGPNIEQLTVADKDIDCRFIKTDYSTVVSEVHYIVDTSQDRKEKVLGICKDINSPSLIYCKSKQSIYKLADYMIEHNLTVPNTKNGHFAKWVAKFYHKDWDLVKYLEHGIGIHHGALPRSISYHILRLFNEGVIRFLLCTSTIIEGVNTSAQNIIIYDNKVARKNLDYFTFNNIKGRAGRMFRHFIGHVYVFNEDPPISLPNIDIPVITQPDSTPISLLLQIDERELSEHSTKKLKYLHAQNILPIDIIRMNSGINPDMQIKLAETILSDLRYYHDILSWKNIPSKEQLQTICGLIYNIFMSSTPDQDVKSAKQLYFYLLQITKIKDISVLVKETLKRNKQANINDLLNDMFSFVRKWADFKFPKYLSAIDRIQKYIFESNNYESGNYDYYINQVRQLFMPPSATTLEEYGLPYQITIILDKHAPLGDSVDEILQNLKNYDITNIPLSRFSKSIITEVIKNI